MKLFRIIFLLLAFDITASTHAADNDYPNKPVTVIVAYAPGGQGDIFARLVSEKLSVLYKQTVVVDNKPGVSGTIGTKIAARSKNDGYTLFLGQTGEITVNRLLIKDIGYDPMQELTPVVLIGNSPLIMLAAADAPFNTVFEFIQLAGAVVAQYALHALRGCVQVYSFLRCLLLWRHGMIPFSLISRCLSV